MDGRDVIETVNENDSRAPTSASVISTPGSTTIDERMSDGDSDKHGHSKDANGVDWKGSESTFPVTETVLADKSPRPVKSYQIRALTRKTLAYQKRQYVVNICCVALCPLLMVVVSWLLGFIITMLVVNTSPPSVFITCSDQNATNAQGIALGVTDNSTLPGVPISQYPKAPNDAKYINFTNYKVIPQTLGPQISAGCVWWFEHDYEYRAPYENNPQIANAFRRDSTFQPDPQGGWFSVQNLAYPIDLSQSQTSPWAYVWDNTGVNSGAKPQLPSVSIPGGIQGVATLAGGLSGGSAGGNPLAATGGNASAALNPSAIIGANPQYAQIAQFLPYLPIGQNANYSGPQPGQAGFPWPNDTTSTGLLGSIDLNLYANITINNATSDPTQRYVLSDFQPVPYFIKIDSSEPRSNTTSYLTAKIRDTINQLSTVNKSALLDSNPPPEVTLEFYANIASIVTEMPWGALIFDAINTDAKTWNYTLQYGTDSRLANAASFPSRGFRQMVQQSMLSNAFMRASNASALANATITHGYRVMPDYYSSQVNIPIATLAGRVLYPFGVSFLLPIFVIILVREKEERILVMMKMNGLKVRTYYMTHYLHFYSLHVLSTLVFIIAGFACQMELFTRTQPGVYLLLFFIWGFTQNALAFFFAAFFNKNRTALVVTFLIVLGGVIINAALDFLFTNQAPKGYFIWPPFAFYRALSLLSRRTIGKAPIPYRISDLRGDDEVLRALIYLAVEAVVYLIIAAYLSSVLPSQYGVRKPWHFPVTEFFQRRQERHAIRDVTLENGPLANDVDPEETQFEDADVKAERARVLRGDYDPSSPLVMKRMRKLYGAGNKLAVKDMSFAVEPNIIFGLLGPNGAGKTTLISILTGLYKPTSGEAILAGYDTRTQMSDVYRSIGVCPQHDILWDDLTVGEHLLFYARLKGIPPKEENAAMMRSLRMVSLEPFRNRLSKGLSGGEKRRLSIAISLIGDPGVVFLDEPTTGLDPEVRRLIWTIINEAKQGRTLILTTHSMEEAEVLCHRIGIMAKGTFRCLGNQLRLKEVYGRGFKLEFTCKPEDTERVSNYIESLLPSSATKLDSFVIHVSYEFEAQKGLIPMLFREIEAHKKEYGITDWGLSQTTLEEVFLRIIAEDDAEAD
ncbi:hypothetical protein BZG36_01131 [Bifiguratus adelaidae]|uniref:ABC transporter domain-containing protein n=1 Tax=Bifiguratus adelaidae TaxID=1938954 RepID=A0A261Y667_9FUNG|nr:hypothetical protein BZG36_01131 [Bifiguratus adelaidae]